MQIDFFGGNCIKIKTKLINLVFDDNIKQLGGKHIASDNDVVWLTNESLLQPPPKCKTLFSLPGSYEVGDMMVSGIQAQAYMDEKSQRNGTIYKVETMDLKLLIPGHINPDLSDEQLETIGIVDVLFVPVGGNGYTLDTAAAIGLVKKISPKIVIPTHYNQKGLKFEVPQDNYDGFLSAMSVPVDKIQGGGLKLKKADLTEGLVVKVLKQHTPS